jgi:hypothetical protein
MAMSRERVEEGGKEEVLMKGGEVKEDAEEERQRMSARRKLDLREVLSDILDLRDVAEPKNMGIRKRFMCTICMDETKSNLK